MWIADSALAEHQRDACERALDLLRTTGGVILADEPGLGKSFVAAAVAQQYVSDGADIDVIVPASLVQQWEETLAAFGVSAHVMTHDALIADARLPGSAPRLIIVDEAHAFRNPATQRFDALARHSAGARLMLVTATPLCNSLHDLKALISLIAADDAVAALGVPSIEIAFDSRNRESLAIVVGALVIRRGKSVLPDSLRFGELASHVINFDVFTAGGEIDALIDSLTFPLVGETAILKQFLWRRLESSEAALAESVRRQRRFCERALECLAAGQSLPKREYRRAFGHEEDADAFQRMLFWELFAGSHAPVAASEIEAEIARLDRLTVLLRCSTSQKQRSFVDLVTTSEPMLVFTGWAATAAALCDLVRPLRPCAVAMGRDRRGAAEAIAAFQAGRCDVLIATDLAAEGLNLQRAGVVVHYDIPWNPVKVDQRNGRACRIGQQRPAVDAVYFLPHEDRTRVQRIVAAKNQTRRLGLRASPGPEPRVATIRPRVATGAAVIELEEALIRSGRELPDVLARTHKAGVERLIRQFATERFEPSRIDDLYQFFRFEPWAAGLSETAESDADMTPVIPHRRRGT